MNSKQLAYFTAIYETGTLTKASGQVRVAVSALSHHLANLEAELGTELFVRKPRGLVPTAAGNRLYDHAKSILRSISAAETDIRDSGREIAGDVLPDALGGKVFGGAPWRGRRDGLTRLAGRTLRWCASANEGGNGGVTLIVWEAAA